MANLQVASAGFAVTCFGSGHFADIYLARVYGRAINACKQNLVPHTHCCPKHWAILTDYSRSTKSSRQGLKHHNYFAGSCAIQYPAASAGLMKRSGWQLACH